jgi:hypothetical protein
VYVESGNDVEFPPGDYVSPGLRCIKPDACFPFMAIRDRGEITWPYYRKWVAHNFRSDRRSPDVGFVSRDEAHVLYNSALLCQNVPALEIGCWMGWSACHLALAGLTLDVVDPLLSHPDIDRSVRTSLVSAGVLQHVHLIPEGSPAAVMRLHQAASRRWGFIFVDGNHDRPGPLNDAIAVNQVAADDALVLFHDLNSPEVAEGLDYLRDHDWNTMIYQTVQIMAVAWRGAIEPLQHTPDPAVEWSLPDHLTGYRVSTGPEAKRRNRRRNV